MNNILLSNQCLAYIKVQKMTQLLFATTSFEPYNSYESIDRSKQYIEIDHKFEVNSLANFLKNLEHKKELIIWLKNKKEYIQYIQQLSNKKWGIAFIIKDLQSKETIYSTKEQIKFLRQELKSKNRLKEDAFKTYKQWTKTLDSISLNFFIIENIELNLDFDSLKQHINSIQQAKSFFLEKVLYTWTGKKQTLKYIDQVHYSLPLAIQQHLNELYIGVKKGKFIDTSIHYLKAVYQLNKQFRIIKDRNQEHLTHISQFEITIKEIRAELYRLKTLQKTPFYLYVYKGHPVNAIQLMKHYPCIIA